MRALAVKNYSLLKIDNMNNIWIQAFELSIGNVKGYKTRLHELLTWDKPQVEKSKDTNGRWTEWAKKIDALETLIKEEYPNMKITLDNKIKLE